MNTIKVIFLDVDGTLLANPYDKVPQRAVDKIEAMKQKGFEFYINSARNFASSKGICKELNINNFIAANGQIIVKNNEVLQQRFIYEEEKQFLVEDLATLEWGYITPHGVCLVKVNSTISKSEIHEYFGHTKKSTMEQFLKEDVLNIILFPSDSRQINNLYSAFNCYHWAKNYVQISPKNASKGLAIDVIKKSYSHQKVIVYCVGDNDNDISMFHYADVRIAMGNAIDPLKNLSSLVVGTVNEGGIMDALEYIEKYKLSN